MAPNARAVRRTLSNSCTSLSNNKATCPCNTASLGAATGSSGTPAVAVAATVASSAMSRLTLSSRNASANSCLSTSAEPTAASAAAVLLVVVVISGSLDPVASADAIACSKAHASSTARCWKAVACVASIASGCRLCSVGESLKPLPSCLDATNAAASSVRDLTGHDVKLTVLSGVARPSCVPAARPSVIRADV